MFIDFQLSLIYNDFHEVALDVNRISLVFMGLFILHLNIRSFCKHRVELEARLESMLEKPSIIAVTESWIDPSTDHISLSGYTLIVRRNRIKSVAVC